MWVYVKGKGRGAIPPRRDSALINGHPGHKRQLISCPHEEQIGDLIGPAVDCVRTAPRRVTVWPEVTSGQRFGMIEETRAEDPGPTTVRRRVWWRV
jgi:hypothetical protein